MTFRRLFPSIRLFNSANLPYPSLNPSTGVKPEANEDLGNSKVSLLYGLLKRPGNLRGTGKSKEFLYNFIYSWIAAVDKCLLCFP
jgi:hypothetical protein